MVEDGIPWYYLEIKNTKAALAVLVNGVLEHTDRLARNSSQRITVNHWLHDGENTVEVNCSVPPFMQEIPEEFGFGVDVVEYVKTGDDVNRNVLANVAWKHARDELFPVIRRVTFSVSRPRPAWHWYDADVFTAYTLPQEEIRKMVERFFIVLDNGNMEELELLLAVKSEEFALAYSIPLEARRSDQRSFFSGLFSEPGWGMEPPVYETLLSYLHAGGRLVEIIDSRGRPALHSKPIGGDSRFMLSLFLARKNGKWVLCR